MEAVRLPPERKGTPSRAARLRMAKSARAASGVPKVGAPVCIDIVVANEPIITGAPGRTIWVNVIAAIASARVWVAVAATVTGDIAPTMMNGVIRAHWLFSASTWAEPSMARSHCIGELALHSPISTVLSATNCSPKTTLAMSTES